MSQDARIRYTKMAIQKSFMELIKQKPFSRITLKEVCELAEINHSTFYRHYKDIFDWKEQLETSCMEQLKTFLNDFDKTDMRSILLSQLKHYQSNKELYTIMASDYFESTIMERLCTTILDYAEAKVQKMFSKTYDVKHQWDYYYIICGVVGVIRCWTADGMKEPPEYVVEYIMKNISLFMNRDGAI